MKKILLSAIAIGSMATLADAAIDCNMRLSDGSAIKGELLTEKLVGETIFAPSLELAPDIVKSVTLRGTNGVAALELANSDKLTMTLATEAFRLKSIIGEFNVPRANVRSMTLGVKRDAASLAAGGSLVYWCSFDSESDIVRPQVGPEGCYIAGSFVDGKEGKSLCVPAYTLAATVKLPAGVIGDKGCIEFWAKLVERKYGFTDKGDPHFFDIIGPNGVFSLAYNANNGMANSGLCGGTPGTSMTTHPGYRGSMSYEAILSSGDVYEWHHYALVWDSEGIDANGERVYSAIMLDGKFVSKVHTPFAPDSRCTHMMQVAQLPFEIQIPVQRKDVHSHSKAPVCIDEFKIWNFAKTTFE